MLNDREFFARLRDMIQFEEPGPRAFGRGPGNWRAMLPREGTWITAYRSFETENALGVMFRMKPNPGHALWPTLRSQQEAINAELLGQPEWRTKPKYMILSKKSLSEFGPEEADERHLEWLAENMARFWRVFLARI